MGNFLIAKGKFFDFFNLAYRQDGVFAFDEKGNPISKERCNQLANNIIIEKDAKPIFFKSHGFFISPGFDLTHEVFLVDGFESRIIFEMVKKSSLHVLY